MVDLHLTKYETCQTSRISLYRLCAELLAWESSDRLLHPAMATKQQFSSFADLLAGSEQPVLVDFYATWCGPCQMMVPILEQVNGQLKGQLKVVKIDSDRYPQLASQYQIQALPTLVLFKQGQPVDRIEGVLTADQLVKRLQSQL